MLLTFSYWVKSLAGLSKRFELLPLDERMVSTGAAFARVDGAADLIRLVLPLKRVVKVVAMRPSARAAGGANNRCCFFFDNPRNAKLILSL